MKLSKILFAQHKHRWVQRQWRHKGWQIKRHSWAKHTLEQHKIPYENALDYVKEPKPLISFSYDRVIGQRKLRKDENHPDFKETPCLIFKDRDVLVEGLDQAKSLTNTVEIEEGLPQKLVKLKGENAQSENVHKIVEKNLLSALVYDGAQEKLPHRKDPSKPAFVFPRDYGIVDTRRNLLVCNKLVQLCESISQIDISSRVILDQAIFQLALNKGDDLFEFDLRGDKVIMSTTPLSGFVSSEAATSIELPNLHPLKNTISLESTHFYNLRDTFPLHQDASHPYIHTALVHYNETEVRNLYGTPVTESQFYCRSLMKAFTFAAAQAKFLYGPDIKDLPSPYTVQLVQTDAHAFHFSAFQLNTLDISSSGSQRRNIFWSHPLIEICVGWGYESGKPFLAGYNPHVFDLLCAFYKNGSERKTEATSVAAVS